MVMQKITEQQYNVLQRAYDCFNARLFDSELPDALITLNRKRGARGYFWANRFVARGTETSLHEISLNPDCMTEDDTAERVLSTLVHEMTHLWQEEHGKKKPRKAYHNREWADKMEEVGLMPSTTGQEGAPRTGQSCTHYVIDEGPFYWACADFLMCYDALLISSIPQLVLPKSAENKNKVPYVCETCGQKAWAKPDARLMCGVCEEQMSVSE